MRSFERSLCLYGFPVFLVLVGLIGTTLIGSTTVSAKVLDQILAPFNQIALFVSYAAVAVGLLWVGWNAFRQRRLSRGEDQAVVTTQEERPVDR
ncbi:hypothetical protein ACNFH5_15480 [Pseudomonas sp. NY15435]|uniref:hypothetical protein n=1 Tax=Pseudomonas sp. NY15435 TaxID=3400358 RepID=UPI003A8C2809